MKELTVEDWSNYIGFVSALMIGMRCAYTRYIIIQSNYNITRVRTSHPLPLPFPPTEIILLDSTIYPHRLHYVRWMRCWLILALDLEGEHKFWHSAAPSTGWESTANSCDTILPPVVRHNTMPDRKDHEIK